MVEIQHRALEPAELTAFRVATPEAGVEDFDSIGFKSVKSIVKAALHQDQGGLCAYCEQPLTATEGQIDHIKPKSLEPGLCFSYSNYAHSCTVPKTCGQKKKNGLLPIEPGPGCNAQWSLSPTDGMIEPLLALTRAQKHRVIQTRDMLGLNQHSDLVTDRKKWLANAIAVLQVAPNDLPKFLQGAPYRYLLATVF